MPPLDSPGTPSPDVPWCFSPEGAQGAFGLAGVPGPGSDARDSCASWPEEPVPDSQFKRRSCQMEFEEGAVEGRAHSEELAALGKQAGFSGSVEVIEVS